MILIAQAHTKNKGGRGEKERGRRRENEMIDCFTIRIEAISIPLNTLYSIYSHLEGVKMKKKSKQNKYG